MFRPWCRWISLKYTGTIRMVGDIFTRTGMILFADPCVAAANPWMKRSLRKSSKLSIPTVHSTGTHQKFSSIPIMLGSATKPNQQPYSFCSVDSFPVCDGRPWPAVVFAIHASSRGWPCIVEWDRRLPCTFGRGFAEVSKYVCRFDILLALLSYKSAHAEDSSSF